MVIFFKFYPWSPRFCPTYWQTEWELISLYVINTYLVGVYPLSIDIISAHWWLFERHPAIGTASVNYVHPRLFIIKRLAITFMYCNRLHAWWSTQSHLAALRSSLIARRLVKLQTLWWFRLKDLSIDEMVGAWCFGCLSGSQGFTCWISFAPVFSFIHCWVLIFTLSPCYSLIYMF